MIQSSSTSTEIVLNQWTCTILTKLTCRILTYLQSFDKKIERRSPFRIVTLTLEHYFDKKIERRSPFPIIYFGILYSAPIEVWENKTSNMTKCEKSYKNDFLKCEFVTWQTFCLLCTLFYILPRFSKLFQNWEKFWYHLFTVLTKLSWLLSVASV